MNIKELQYGADFQNFIRSIPESELDSTEGVLEGIIDGMLNDEPGPETLRSGIACAFNLGRFYQHRKETGVGNDPA